MGDQVQVGSTMFGPSTPATTPVELAGTKFPNTTNAQEWVNAFRRTFESIGSDIRDDILLGWFANAIETGRAAGSSTASVSRELA